MAGVTSVRNTFGAILKYGGTPTTFAKQVTITPNKPNVGVIDVSHHGSTVVEKIPDSLVDGGKIAFTSQYISATLTAVNALLATSTTWSITYPGGDVASFSGVLTTFGVDELQVKGATLTYSGEIEVAGAITWTMA